MTMKRQIAVILISAAPMLAATFTGVVTDSLCENGDHASMKMPDAKCVLACVKGMNGKYVLFDGKTAYALSDQKTPEKFAGQKVTVTGTLDAKTKTIRVEAMAAAK